MPTTKLLLSTGERLEVEGLVNDVERRLQDAARSTSGAIAWLSDASNGEPVGVNPAHVVTLRPGAD